MNLRRLDVVLLLVLVTARVRIDTLADLAAPRPVETIRKISWLSGLLSEPAWKLLEDWLTDPLSLLLISIVFTLVLAYVVVDLWQRPRVNRTSEQEVPGFRVKMGLVLAIVGITVVVQSLYLAGLRHVSGPATYTHDGGVIQTEETIKFLLQGKNPYAEDYTKTPMADWGLDYKTALYHFPYLPWTFLFSLPFFLVSNATLGWFDERFVYLILFMLTLLLAARLNAGQFVRLAIVMVIGLNPIMASDVIFGQNDSFVLFWLLAALVVAQFSASEITAGNCKAEKTRQADWARPAALVLLALACASKPTAWFLAPFFLLFVFRRDVTNEVVAKGEWKKAVRDLLPSVVVFALVVLPFVLWDPFNFYDDVWAWSSGTSATAYQIRGWGLSNFVLALDLVSSRLDYFPFWVPEIVICLPLFVVMIRRQLRENTLANVTWHGTVLLFAFAYSSRFLNENYLGFMLALLAVGWALERVPHREMANPAAAADG